MMFFSIVSSVLLPAVSLAALVVAFRYAIHVLSAWMDMDYALQVDQGGGRLGDNGVASARRSMGWAGAFSVFGLMASVMAALGVLTASSVGGWRPYALVGAVIAGTSLIRAAVSIYDRLEQSFEATTGISSRQARLILTGGIDRIGS